MYGRQDKNYEAFDQARAVIRRTRSFLGNDPMVKVAVDHFRRMWETGPIREDLATAWRFNKRITIGYEAHRDARMGRTIADPKTHEAFTHDDIAVAMRARAFKNVMEAYITLVLALTRSTELGFMDEATRAKYRAEGAPDLPAGLKWMDVTDRVRSAQRYMNTYGSDGGQLTVGLNTRAMPGFYDAFRTTVAAIADEALRTRGDVSQALMAETGFPGIPNPGRDPVAFMSAAQHELTEWGKLTEKEKREKIYAAEEVAKKQRKSMRDAPREGGQKQAESSAAMQEAFSQLRAAGKLGASVEPGFEFAGTPQVAPEPVPVQSTGFPSMFEVDDTVVEAGDVASAFNFNPRPSRRLPRSHRGQF
jgi:hypothetical protein